jgi:glycerol-3-phosphate acyltransferase PlsX
MQAGEPGAPRVVALDGMGGDRAPDSVCEAAAVISRTTSIRLRVAGPKARLEPLLARFGADASRVELIDCADAVPMHEDPRAALGRTRSSLAHAVADVAEGRAEAVVSAGNTGALLLHAARAIPRLPGVRRAALAAVYPARPRPHNPDPFALLLDVGANVACEPADLVGFATMGCAYAARISKVEQPSVGLLNIGEEPAKGDTLLREAHALLAASPGLRFLGNVEGKDVPLGVVDVVVCPGVLGNVVLKLLESLGEVVLARGEALFHERADWRLGRWLLRGGLAKLSDFFDYAAYGGAPILGLERMVLKAHGRSHARALENAIKVAAKAVRDDVCGAIAAGLAAAGEPTLREGHPA